jgi:hypothetical protein
MIFGGFIVVATIILRAVSYVILAIRILSRVAHHPPNLRPEWQLIPVRNPKTQPFALIS